MPWETTIAKNITPDNIYRFGDTWECLTVETQESGAIRGVRRMMKSGKTDSFYLYSNRTVVEVWVEPKFKVGDRVCMSEVGRLKYKHKETNPHSGIGVVTRVAGSGALPISVTWDTGRVNVYEHNQLEVVELWADVPLAKQKELYDAYVEDRLKIQSGIKLQGGKTYLSKDGETWKCKFLEDDIAWMLREDSAVVALIRFDRHTGVSYTGATRLVQTV